MENETNEQVNLLTAKELLSLEKGTEVETVLLVKEFNKRFTKTLKSYGEFILTDRTGAIKAKKWDLLSNENPKAGDVMEITGKTDDYNGEKSIVISFMSKIEIDPSEFTLTAFEQKPSEMASSLKNIVETVKHPGLKKILEETVLASEDFLVWPAASKNHHAEVNGLLAHTLDVAERTAAMCDLDNRFSNKVNRDIAVTGALLHDWGKLKELVPNPTGAGDYTKYSLMGHIELSAETVHDYAVKGVIDEETEIQLKHVILAHHGELEYGSPVKPMTIEAVIVSFCDNMSAKVAALENEYLQMADGELAKQANFCLGGRAYKPMPLK